jgi:HSP20 family molecular chaperone IbpA
LNFSAAFKLRCVAAGNGVLSLTLPKKEGTCSRRIAIE